MKAAALQFNLRSAMRAILIGSVTSLAAIAGNQAWANPDPGQSNLAAGKTATATESDFGGLISYGVDGNRDGNFSDGSVFYGNSDPGNPPLYYQVDLGQNDYINRVQFMPRTDVSQNVFGNFNISIYPDNGSGSPAATPSFSQNYNSSYFGDSFATADPGAAAPGGANGRFVRITRLDNNYWLTFAEMEVIGASTPLQYTAANNIALGRPVTTSSAPGFGALITSGNDGNISGDFNDPARPVYHSSNHSVGEYWQVDLGSNKQLAYANLFTRAGKDNGNTTHQFEVDVFDSGLNLVDTVLVDNADVNGTTPDFDHAINLAGITGQYIRVATTSDSYLALAELQVFAAGPPVNPGDVNLDGQVNQLDLNIVNSHFLQSGATRATGDLNGDGQVNQLDLNLVNGNWLGTGGTGSFAAVPEPASFVLAALGAAAIGLVGWRRCKINSLSLLPSCPGHIHPS